MRTVFFAWICALLFLPLWVEAGRVSGDMEFGIGTGGVFGTDDVSEPMLLSPVGETVDLTGEETLEFKWSPFEGRVYKTAGV